MNVGDGPLKTELVADTDIGLAVRDARFRLWPLMFEGFACSLSMMAFVAIIGPLARIMGLAPWQVGTAVTSAGVAWIVFARIWGAASDRFGRRPACCSAWSASP